MNLPKLVVSLTLLLLSLSSATPQRQTYHPKNKNPNGVELIAVYIGAEFCGPCHDPQFKKALRKLKTILDDRAAKAQQSFSVTGVSTDWEVEKGIKYLGSIGPFDEIIAGKSLFNHAASEYIWKDSSGSPVVPQLVLIEREVNYKDGRVLISNCRVLGRRLGTAEIISWVDKGAPRLVD
jgi:hypothetical protein